VARTPIAGDERATSELVSAPQAPQPADEWFAGWLPGQEGWLHRDLATALAARATDLETVLPAALGLTTLSRTLFYDHDLAPFFRLAFPEPLTKHSTLTPAQREFLRALLASPHLPFGKTLCRALLGT
jgi:hypothetical protein